jgi:phosphoglycolate phosphatase
MKLLIFDFDGTIADTKSLYYTVILHELRVFGYSEKDIERVIDLGVTLRKILKKLGLSFITSYFLHFRIMRRVKKHVNEIKKCRDVSSISKIKTKKIVVSNSLKEFVLPILRHLKIKKYFSEIYGGDDFSDKAEFISSYLEKKQIDKEDCYYIGDRVADIKTAKKVGCKSIAVFGKCAWNSRADLKKEKPDFLISDLAEINKIL